MFFIVVWIICIVSAFLISIFLFKDKISSRLLFENLEYFNSKKYKVNINFSKTFRLIKIHLIISYVLASVATIIFFVGFFIKYDEEFNVVAFIIAEKILMTTILFYTWALVGIVNAYNNKNYNFYNKYLTEKDNEDWESYFLPLSSLNIEDEKFQIVNKFLVDRNIKICTMFIWNRGYTKFVPLFSYERLQKIFSKFKYVKTKMLFLNNLFFEKPRTLAFGERLYLDREIISYLYHILCKSLIE
ncbi:hypothetical protein PT313_00090 [Metamycoplasma hyosynoviae]|uniref:hypothetical protein n=1 Tax=Metamycoplasma hyosynoviae TaxID=29559 RepID=UPI00235E2D1C|nr:hypothetical protein [Metamycoplasma hyosynoviae]MDD1374000.1 hypothetical protein [Metamycoplasma hyosynoviae]MDD1374649.1 hypothetical protein [Metamycoplasma hyosynoviae]